jgi:hypothetical protein
MVAAGGWLGIHPRASLRIALFDYIPLNGTLVLFGGDNDATASGSIPDLSDSQKRRVNEREMVPGRRATLWMP